MIPPESVKLRTGDAEIVFRRGAITVHMKYEVYHEALDEVVDAGTVQISVPSVKSLATVGQQLDQKAQVMLIEFRAAHEPILGNLSAFDAGMILNNWWFEDDRMYHPLCGEFLGGVGTSLQARVGAILDYVLPPPTWAWADSPQEGKLRVKCVGVSGADSYNVYSGDNLVGNANNATWHTFDATPGSHIVRIAPLQNLQVGIPSFPMNVHVIGEEPIAIPGEPSPLRTFWRGVLYGA